MNETAFSVRSIALFSSITLLLGVFIGYTVGPVTIGHDAEDEEAMEEDLHDEPAPAANATTDELARRLAELQDQLVEENYRFLTAQKRAEMLEQELQTLRKTPLQPAVTPPAQGELSARLDAFQSWAVMRNAELKEALATADAAAARTLRDAYWREVTVASSGLREAVLADTATFATWADTVTNPDALSLLFGEVLAGMRYTGGMFLYDETAYAALPPALQELLLRWGRASDPGRTRAALLLLRHLRGVPPETKHEFYPHIGSAYPAVAEAALALVEGEAELPASLLDALLSAGERGLSVNAQGGALQALALVDDPRAMRHVSTILQNGEAAQAAHCARGLQRRSATVQQSEAETVSSALLAALKRHASASVRAELLGAALALPMEQAVATCKAAIPLLESTTARSLVQDAVDRLERGEARAQLIQSLRAGLLALKQ